MAPKRAFERIAISPEWLLAFAIVVALSLASVLLELPALQHVFTVTNHPLHSTQLSRQELSENLLLGSTLVPLIGILLEASVLTFFAGIRDASQLRSYRTFVSLAANCAILAALGELVGALGVRLHDPSTFPDFRSIETAVPITFGGLAAHGNESQVDFLSQFGIFDIWSNIVLAYGYARLAKVGFTTALVVAFALDLVLGILFTMK